MHSHEQGLKRWFRVMDALEESKVKAYLGIAILAMAMVAISYCGNLPLLENTNPPSAPSYAPSPAPSSEDDYYRIVFEDRKALFRPFYYGIITVVLCMSGVILSRWRTYIDPVPDKIIDGDTIHSARVEFADPVVQAFVWIVSYMYLVQGCASSLYTMVMVNAFQAQKDTGLDGAVWTTVVLLSTLSVPVTVLLGFALLSCYRGRELRANSQD